MLVTLEMSFSMVNLKKFYITAGPEFGASLHGKKNLITDKSLFGLKTSAARFHEHLAESLLRLVFKKPHMIRIYGW